MASGLDSKAVFSKRALDAGLGQTLDLLTNGGVASFGSLAFITAHRPGQSDEQRFVQALETEMKRLPSNPELIVLQRLFFEACTPSEGSSCRCALQPRV